MAFQILQALYNYCQQILPYVHESPHLMPHLPRHCEQCTVPSVKYTTHFIKQLYLFNYSHPHTLSNEQKKNKKSLACTHFKNCGNGYSNSQYTNFQDELFAIPYQCYINLLQKHTSWCNSKPQYRYY